MALFPALLFRFYECKLAREQICFFAPVARCYVIYDWLRVMPC